MLEQPDAFHELTIILAVSAGLGALAVLLRQPLIIGFIAAGIACGPVGFDLLADDETWDLLASAGIAILLFVVGLKLDLEVVRRIGPVALASGLGQVGFTSLFGFVICLGLGLSTIHAIYVAVALTFSSTIIIVKLLSDKREIDSLHGRIAVGLLIVQDIVVVLVMIGLSAAADTQGSSLPERAILVIAKGAGLLLLLAVLMRYVLPLLFGLTARSQEMLILAGIAWATVLAVVAVELGFSEEVGAFLAGVSLASTQFREAISSRLVSLRDFLLLFFFITLGAELNFDEIASQFLPALVLSLFVLIGNPLIVMAIMGLLGYRRRTGFLTGLTVAQISEFSFILGALGVSLGHLSSERLGLITLVGLITIGVSTYLILYSHRLYELMAPWLGPFERKVAFAEVSEPGPEGVEVIVFGLGRFGGRIAEELGSRGFRVLGVDFDPQALRSARERGLFTTYGDAEDPEFHAHLPLGSAMWVVGAMPELIANRALLRCLDHHDYRGKVAVTAHNQHDAVRLTADGASLVLRPFEDAAVQAVDQLTATTHPR